MCTSASRSRAAPPPELWLAHVEIGTQIDVDPDFPDQTDLDGLVTWEAERTSPAVETLRSPM